MIAMLIGTLGIAANCVIYQQKNGKNLLLWKLISDILWFFHYLFLGAYSGSSVAIIAVFRELVFYKENQKERKNIFYLLFFLFAPILFTILTWNGVMSIFTALASIISIIGFWKANPVLSRVIAFPVSGLMLTYDVCCSSYVGIVNEVLTLFATTFAIIYNLYKRKVDKNENRSC